MTCLRTLTDLHAAVQCLQCSAVQMMHHVIHCAFHDLGMRIQLPLCYIFTGIYLFAAVSLVLSLNKACRFIEYE